MFSGVAPLFHVSSLPETELSITQDTDNGLEAELNPIEDARSKWVVLCPAFTSIYIYILPENLQLKTALMVFELPLDIIVAPLPQELYQELDSECRGPVYLRGDPKYVS